VLLSAVSVVLLPAVSVDRQSLSYGLVSSITADRPGRVRRSAVTTDT